MIFMNPISQNLLKKKFGKKFRVDDFKFRWPRRDCGEIGEKSIPPDLILIWIPDQVRNDRKLGNTSIAPQNVG